VKYGRKYFYIITPPLQNDTYRQVSRSSIVLDDQDSLFVTINKEFEKKSFEKTW